MKKLLCTFLIGALLFTGAGIACLQSASADETLAETDYFASDFTELPSDWELSDQCCGEEYMDTSYADGDMVIRQDPAVAVGAARYYGSLYLIDKDTAYEDFTFEITFKMTEAKDDGRWMGIVYHLQKRIGYPIGYMMNYRYGGKREQRICRRRKIARAFPERRGVSYRKNRNARDAGATYSGRKNNYGMGYLGTKSASRRGFDGRRFRIDCKSICRERAKRSNQSYGSMASYARSATRSR